MRPLHYCIRIVVAGLITAIPATVQSQTASLWEHNASVVGLFADGAMRVFRYQEPRIGMQQEGVVPGTVLFEGTRSGASYTGTAYVFSRRCGAHPYAVSGGIAPDERQITLNGNAPAGFDAACRPTAYRQDVLQFNFLQPTAPPPLVSGFLQRDDSAAKAADDHRLRILQADADRIRREREHEERRLAGLRAFTAQRDGCRRYDIAACQTALRSPHANAQDQNDLWAWRATALQFQTDFDACRAGSISGCDAALASPAVTDALQRSIREWRTAASPLSRVLAFLSTQIGAVAAYISDGASAITSLPTSTHIAGGVAALLALMLAAAAVGRRQGAAPSHEQESPAESPAGMTTSDADAGPARTAGPASSWPDRLSKSVGNLRAGISRPKPTEPTHSSNVASTPSAARDTPGAIAALELTHAYLEEVREADRPAFDDTDTRKHHLNTLALAAKRLDAAQKLDPDAMLEGQDDRDIPYRFSIDELKAEALLLEGLTHQTYDIKRAIPALRRATTLNPSNPTAFYVLGLTHAANRNKAEAVAAFERAVALDPKNIAYRKELNRVESLSAAEIAGYKATRAGEKIFDAGIKTANAGIMAWNIFAVLWNIATFPLRLVFGIFRFLGLAGFR